MKKWLPLVFMFSFSLFAQRLTFETIGLAQGLPQNSGNAIWQDRLGFIWIGTQDGLARWDGYKMKIFQSDPSDSNSLVDNFILTIKEDREGNLLIGTNNGFSLFDPRVEKFKNYRSQRDNRAGLSGNVVRGIMQDASDKIWLATQGGGVSVWDRSAEKFQVYHSDSMNRTTLSSDQTAYLLCDTKGRVWVATSAGLDLFHPKTISFERIPAFQGSNVTSLYEDRQGSFWVGTTLGLYRYDPSTGAKESFRSDAKDRSTLSSDFINHVYEDRSGSLWVGTTVGLNEMDRQLGKFTRYIHDALDPQSIAEDVISAILEDRSGSIWVGTGGGGVSKFNRVQKKFRVYRNEPSNPQSLRHNLIWSFVEKNKNEIWLSTQGAGIVKFDPQTGVARHFRSDPNNKKSIGSDVVFALRQDSHGVLWAGTSNAGLNSFDPSFPEKGFIRYPPGRDSLQSAFVRAINIDAEDQVWAGTFGGGLSVLDAGRKRFMTYLNNPDDLKSLANNFILTLYRDRDGTLFIGTLNGLSIFDAKTQQFTNFYHDPKNSNSLSGSRIRSIFQDSKGIYWVGTDDGLSRWDRGINMFQRITKNDGLPNNVVYGVLEDDHGRYWISTNRGLSRMTADASHHYSFRNYDVDDGLQSREFNTNSFLKSEDGEMYFGGVNGLNIFHPDSVRDNLNLAPIVLTGFNTNGSHYQMDESICFCKAIEISYKENYFSLEFASLDYANPEKNQYAYKMDGFEEDWTYSGNRRFVSYTNLEPGTYTFHVKGTNSDGLWNEVGASVVITITPPFWKTWWFRLMTLLAIVGSIVSMHKVRTRSIKTQKRKLEQEVIQRTKEINQQKEILVEQNDQLIGQSREIEAQRDTLQQINGQLELAIVNLKNAEAQLIQAEKMASLGQMVAGITHEINNPLSFIDSNLPFFEDYSKRYAAIIGEIELHLGAHASNGMQKELERIKEKYEFALINRDTLDIVNSCRHGSKRIKQIVDDLRQFSRLDESGTKQTNLNDCLDTTLTLLENQYSDRIEVHREYGKLPLVECYPAKLNQVFLNILTNAIQAVSSGGVVEVATEVQGDWAIVRIKDNGQGMTEAIKHKIFDPFFTTKDVGKGTGLGLSIAYGIIKEHNGNIDVESQPGTGSTFVIRIPILFNGLGKFNARNN